MKPPLLSLLFAASLAGASCSSTPPTPVDSPPVPVSQRRPAYPIELLQRGIVENMVVEVEFTITNSGEVVEPRVLTDCRPEYAKLAIPCVLTWKFQPRIQNGIPVITRMRVPIYFAAQEVEKKPTQ